MAWVTRHGAYVAACQRIATELRTAPATSQFKQDPDYRAVVGNDTRKAAIAAAFYQACRVLVPDVATLHATVAVNDRIGAPVLHPIDGHDWSAGSLRYFQGSREVISRFGTDHPVVEIGGGYGGQRVLLPEITSYTILDLPAAGAVQRAYLAAAVPDLPTQILPADQAAQAPAHAILISDFALSELEAPARAAYFAQVVDRCIGGRLTMAADMAETFTLALRRLGFRVEIVPEQPVTSPRHPNVVLWFGDRPADRTTLTTPSRGETFRDLLSRLRTRTPFAFSRWGDGEWAAVLGHGHANCDGQRYTPALRAALAGVLEQRPPYLLGLQSLALRRYGPEILAWLHERQLWPTWQAADVWHYASMHQRVDELIAVLQQRIVVFVGPAALRPIAQRLGAVQVVTIPDRAAFDQLPAIRRALQQAVQVAGPGSVVALSAGMVANLLIDDFAGTLRLLPSPPETTWIDFGALWEPYVGIRNRRYHAEILARLAQTAPPPPLGSATPPEIIP